MHLARIIPANHKQIGLGFGSFLAKAASYIPKIFGAVLNSSPIQRGLTSLKETGLKKASQFASDVFSGKNIKESAKSRLAETKDAVLKSVFDNENTPSEATVDSTNEDSSNGRPPPTRTVKQSGRRPPSAAVMPAKRGRPSFKTKMPNRLDAQRINRFFSKNNN